MCDIFYYYQNTLTSANNNSSQYLLNSYTYNSSTEAEVNGSNEKEKMIEE